MVRVLVIHDILYEAEEVKEHLMSCYEECQVTLCVGAGKNEIIEIIEKESKTTDVCFTMIKMKSISGIEVAQKLRKDNPKIKIAFMASTDEYALDAWRIGINAYLLRPLTVEKIQTAADNM